MGEIRIPDALAAEIEAIPEDKSAFATEAIAEKLTELKLEKSKAMRKLLSSVFKRMTRDSKLADKDCLRFGREVNEAVAKRYGLVE